MSRKTVSTMSQIFQRRSTAIFLYVALFILLAFVFITPSFIWDPFASPTPNLSPSDSLTSSEKSSRAIFSASSADGNSAAKGSGCGSSRELMQRSGSDSPDQSLGLRSMHATAGVNGSRAGQSFVDLAFVPNDFQCEEMYEMSGVEFLYPQGYTEHADAYKSVMLGLDNLIQMATPNEQTFMLIDMARLPFVRSVCEAGFFAGHNALHFLSANNNVVLHTFENSQRFNFTLDVLDFMSIEFPYRFFHHEGRPIDTIRRIVEAGGMDGENAIACDLVFVNSIKENPEMIRNLLRMLRKLVRGVENIVVVNAHPRSIVGKGDKVMEKVGTVWEDLKKEAVVYERFRCNFTNDDFSADQRGLLVGSYRV